MTARGQRETTRGAAGFTLVELLVALAILGLLSALLYSGLAQGARSWRAVEARSDATGSVANAQSFLRERLAGVSRLDATPPQPGEPPAHPFAGTEAGLSFAAPWLTRLPVAGLYRLALSAEPGADGTLTLRLAWRPEGEPLSPRDRQRLTRERIAGTRDLVGGLREVAFRYYGDPSGRGEDGWRDRWPADAGPPRLVRIEARFADPALAWPSFTVALP